ncbi:GAF domain-containing protein [Jannaschia sp. Os4]|uniref:HWE histidine kinase domain-containing protein n=1 Tax=Jannaschia sp. Os4 TaxID=2807617 RepID=UPI00193A919D|nr:HWE histidine kinase domain-containing protein [Jannaschia sp. Os4]MBM2576036.1 GAF domain-containing protein [Jannaschia sp. Os4]
MRDSDGSRWTEETVDLTNCDREPIHQLGRVQAYGVLIAISSDWIVRHVSTNVADLLGLSPDEMVGTPLSDHVSADAIRALQSRMQGLGRDLEQVRLFGLEVRDRDCDVSIHLSGRDVVLELEPRHAPRAGDEVSLVHPLIGRVRRRDTVEEVSAEAARGLRALTGFDRVMVYRFDPDGSGTVIAESAAPRIESFLGLRYPASDIPKQARALYKRSLLRLIADVDGETYPIVPETNPDGHAPDLSLSVTRAVSPIHLEYLRNMGVRASMSVSILRKGELWGLFACHHYGPMSVGFERRTAVELFGQLFSYELAQKESDAERAQAEEARALHDALIARVSMGGDLTESLDLVAEEIGRALPFDGIAIYSGGEYVARGHAPTREEFLGLARYLNTTPTAQVFATHEAQARYPAAAEFSKPVAGLMALPISRTPRDYIVLFRDEVASEVVWAGNPDKPVEASGPNGVRLTPRKSFEAWRQTVHGQSRRWSRAEIATAEALRVTLLEVVLKIADEANRARKLAEEKQDLLIAELNHRVRNILNLIRGLVSQGRAEAATLEGYTRELDGRIAALARAHDMLTDGAWSAASVKEMLRTEAEAFADADLRQRVAVEGADAALEPTGYTAVALVIHEMMTNSCKYGALSVPEGRVEVSLDREEDGALTIRWRDRFGPVVRAPTRRGFGTTLIERSIPYELKGEAELSFAPTGVEGRFVVPARFVRAAPDEGASAPSPAASEAAGPLEWDGLALVVEDNMIIALDTSDMLEDMGATVRMAGTVAEAMAVLEADAIGLAVLDVNLGDTNSLPVAEALAERGVPFVLVTGYGDGEITAAYPPAPVLRKPYAPDEFRARIAEVLG